MENILFCIGRYYKKSHKDENTLKIKKYYKISVNN